MAKIRIEGQTIEMSDEVAADDELLKATLAPAWPDVRTATFKREGGKDGKELVVTVQKRAGTKGNLIDRLLAAPDGVNPAVEMSCRITEMARTGELSQALIEEMLPEIGRAADAGERDLDAANSAFRDLKDAGCIASKRVPLGF